MTQPVGENLEISFQAKNLTNPKIEQVYRSDFVDREAVMRSTRKGIDLSLSLAYRFK